MDFEQTPLVLSSTFYFGPKIAFSIYGSEETCLTTYCTMDNAAPDGDIFWISFAVVILRRWKVVRWVLFYWITDYLSKIERRLQKKTLRLALEYVKNYWSGLSLIALGCSAGQILVQKLPPTTDSSCKETSFFRLCACASLSVLHLLGCAAIDLK